MGIISLCLSISSICLSTILLVIEIWKYRNIAIEKKEAYDNRKENDEREEEFFRASKRMKESISAYERESQKVLDTLSEMLDINPSMEQSDPDRDESGNGNPCDIDNDSYKS